MPWKRDDEAAARRCAVRLLTAARLALIEVDGTEPESAAEYLVLAVDSLHKDLERLRRVTAAHAG